MDPFHARLARVALAAAGPYGFALAAGYAVQAHGFLDRPSADLDIFTTSRGEEDFPAAVNAVLVALRNDGLISEAGPRRRSSCRSPGVSRAAKSVIPGTNCSINYTNSISNHPGLARGSSWRIAPGTTRAKGRILYVSLPNWDIREIAGHASVPGPGNACGHTAHLGREQCSRHDLIMGCLRRIERVVI